jgi:hypothetical protein
VADDWCWFVLREEYCWLVCCERKVLLAGWWLNRLLVASNNSFSGQQAASTEFGCEQ